MRKRKNLSGVSLLLLAHALVLLFDVAVIPVLCVKKSGSVNMELAFFDFQCPCKDKNGCTHISHRDMETGSQLCEEFNFCVDLPRDGNWQNRYISSGNDSIHIITFSNIDLDLHSYECDAYGSFFGSIPLSKFLHTTVPGNVYAILRC
jgi:hypothetical protein